MFRLFAYTNNMGNFYSKSKSKNTHTHDHAHDGVLWLFLERARETEIVVTHSLYNCRRCCIRFRWQNQRRIAMATFCERSILLLTPENLLFMVSHYLLTLPKHDGRHICTNFHLHIDAHKRTRLRIQTSHRISSIQLCLVAKT